MLKRLHEESRNESKPMLIEPSDGRRYGCYRDVGEKTRLLIVSSSTVALATRKRRTWCREEETGARASERRRTTDDG